MVSDNRFGGLTADELDEVERFHGHMCPGLALGVHAARLALTEVGPHTPQREVVAVSETSMCAVDAVQFLTGCTFGKGNLIHRDFGKNVFSFYRPADGRAVRLAVVPDSIPPDHEHMALFAKVRAGQASDEERQRFIRRHRTRSLDVLVRPPTDFYTVTRFMGSPPPQVRVPSTIVCDECGEGAMASHMTRHDGRDLCRPCLEQTASGPRDHAPPRKGPNLLAP